jgi:hypothetical protein
MQARTIASTKTMTRSSEHFMSLMNHPLVEPSAGLFLGIPRCPRVSSVVRVYDATPQRE